MDGSTSTHGSACVTCRRRRRKCDKTLPSCYRCEARGVLCEGYVLRWTEAVSSNPSYATKSRESFPQSRARKLSRLHHAQSPSLVSAEDVAGYRFTGHYCLQASPGASAPSPTERSDSSSILSPASLPGHHSGENDGYLIDPATIPDGLGDLVNYDAQHVGSRFFLDAEPSENPYLLHIVPMASTVPPVRFALASQASCHLATRFGDHRLFEQSLRLRITAINLLRQRLHDPIPSQAPGSLAAIQLLAQLDLCLGYCTELDIHLRAAKDLMESSTTELSPRGFVEQGLICLDIMGSTTSSREPVFTQAELYKHTTLKTPTPDQEWSFEVLPCPLFLVDIIASATLMYKSALRDDMRADELLTQKALCLKHRLLEWQPRPQKTRNRVHLVQAFRSGVLLFLNGLFNLGAGHTERSRLVSDVVFHAKAIPRATEWCHMVAWPLYQVGLDSVQDHATQLWLRDHFQSLLLSSGCRHAKHAVGALEALWATNKEAPSRLSVPPGVLEGFLIIG